MKNPFKSSLYSLRKAKQILQHGYRLHRKKAKKLSESTLSVFERDLDQLDDAIKGQNRPEADRIARRLEDFYAKQFKKKGIDYLFEVAVAIGLALLIAVVIRQSVFEPYEIPTGSMRPTFREQDHLIVSKTTFGINTPLMTDHLMFEPKLVERGGVVIWSGDNVDLPDTDSTFLGIFPYKKRYIKRLIGKPGDTLYFYGGLLYGIDRDGNEISDFRTNPWLQKLDHIPFINFEGRTSVEKAKTKRSQLVFSQMNRPIGRVVFDNYRELDGEVFNGSEWVKDDPLAEHTDHTSPATLSDFWGMRNYAMARLLTKDQVIQFSDSSAFEGQLPDAPLYLELRHHPSLTYPQPRILSDRYDRFSILLSPLISVIPLQQKDLDAIMNAMYTARFVVKDGQAKRYDAQSTAFSAHDPAMKGIPDGTYEFYDGKASKISWGGITEELPSNHPLYNHSPKFVQQLFNLGPLMIKAFEPTSKNQHLFPHRYAYFRNGSLYLMGAPIWHGDDPTLTAFLNNEARRQSSGTNTASYTAFKDFGPPIHADGTIDKEFIRAFGINIPEKHYMVLGDNYSNSADSREFGFVPEANIQGAPFFILWPPGSRWGSPPQQPYPWMTLPHLIVWGLLCLSLGLWWFIHKRNSRKPTFTTR
jgi:signal peptidase I